MKESKITGWKKVFAFTFIQNLKSPVQIVTTVILCVCALLSMPLMMLLQNAGNDAGKQETSIEQLVIVDETELSLRDWLDLGAMEFDGVLPQEILFSEEDFDTVSQELSETEEGKKAVIQIRFAPEEGGFFVLGTYGARTAVSEEDVEDLVTLIADNLQGQLVGQMGIEQDKLDYLNREIITNVSYYEVNEEGKGEITEEPEEEETGNLTIVEYTVVMALMMIVLFMVSVNGEQVASSVIAEKSSKVVEYLLISVKPLALLVGKVLAVFAMTLMQMLLLAVCFVLSNVFYVLLNPGTTLTLLDLANMLFAEEGSALGETLAASALHPETLPVCVLLLLGGTLFYSVIAGLMGACVSRSEELTEAMKLYSILMVVGAYLGLGVMMMEMAGTAPEAFKMTAAILPFSSIFIVPGYIFLGKMSLGIGLLSLAVLLVSLVLCFKLAANVYEVLIYHKGNPIRLKELFQINKEAGKKRRASNA